MLAASLLLICTAPALACGPEDCGPPKPEAPQPEAPKPEAPKPEAPKPEAPQPEAPKPEAPKPDNDPQPTIAQPEWMPCCTKGGVTLIHTEAWLRLLHGKAKAAQITRAYCTEQAVLPECKSWEPKQ